MITSLVFLYGAAIASPEPAPHSLFITQDTPCGTCTVSNRADALAFEIADGRLGLFADFPAGENSVAILEVIGIDQPRFQPEIHYNEVENGQIVFEGRIERASFALRRIAPNLALIVGTLSFDVVAANGERRVFREIRVVPPEQVSGTDPYHGGGGGGGGVVVVHESYYVHDYGCGGGGSSYASDGGCEGDSASSSDSGCEGDTSSADTGCEGDSSGGSGCSGSDSCEGDYAAASQSAMIGSLWRLLWPIVSVGAWNRRQRNKKR